MNKNNNIIIRNQNNEEGDIQIPNPFYDPMMNNMLHPNNNIINIENQINNNSIQNANNNNNSNNSNIYEYIFNLGPTRCVLNNIKNQIPQINNLNRNQNDTQISQYNQNIISYIHLPNPNLSNNEEKKFLSKHKKPSLTGLKDLGNTSYLNSVLQLICSSLPFATYFSDKCSGECFEKNPNYFSLSFVIHRLCTHIYPEKDIKEMYKGDKVKQILGYYI